MYEVKFIIDIDSVTGEYKYSTGYLDVSSVSAFSYIEETEQIYIVADGVEHHIDYSDRVFKALMQHAKNVSLSRKLITKGLWN